MTMKLENVRVGDRIEGIVPNQAVTIVSVTWHDSSIEIVYKRADGKVDTELLFRSHETVLSPARPTPYWQIDKGSFSLKIISEAYRIRLAHLFDPRLAVHTSLIEPLPHQITAVYSEMLPRQPLRFLLADDPGAGKTIMAGLLIKELIIRGDVRRCLVCAPGNLTEQWQDELWRKFQLRFDILTRDTLEASHTGNPFEEYDQLIIRLDQVARDEDLKALIANSEWDLIVCDEAHKMSASYFGRELKETKRHKLGKILSGVTRHFLLMTATPHNGKEEDFQLFMRLIDRDRFELHRGDDLPSIDISDIMRRMVKEDLLKFDGRPLFPERRAYTVNYQLSADEQALYEAVTDYVREEFNKAERLENGGRRGTVGFALTILQRRLASSSEAIYKSLKRRRERLEKRRDEVQRDKRIMEALESGETYDPEYLDDLDDFPDADFEELEIELADSATAAQTIHELEAEIDVLRGLEAEARAVRNKGSDRKWEQLAELMDNDLMRAPGGRRRKIVIFTEHRDTLNYLQRKLSTLLGDPNTIMTIHGGIRRNDRLDAEDRFRNDPSICVLLATDAAGEGINLQRAHLMVNYDLPWNPNRLEQRFGRIHRIGQTEVCHLWNLVASETREGQVYTRLLEKLRVERGSLNGKVFDVLGKLFEEESLRTLLVKAIRYGNSPEVRAQLQQAVDNALDQERVRDLLAHHALVQDSMDISQIEQVRADMERAAVRRLQPYYVKAFFMDAFELLGGKVFKREPGRYQINHVPAAIRNRARDISGRERVQTAYERICFEKALINVPGKPDAEFICPGHIFLDAVIALIMEQHRHMLADGRVLVAPGDFSQGPRALYYLEHVLRDASPEQRVISREVHFVEVGADGEMRGAGVAPYIDYRPPTEAEREQIQKLTRAQLPEESAEQQARSFAISELAPKHLQTVQERRERLLDKTLAAVQARLTREINHWDERARDLRTDERQGKRNARLNWRRAQARADRLAERLESRKHELEQQRQIGAAPPNIVGRVLVVPMGMLVEAREDENTRRITEAAAMQAVMNAEARLGNDPRDVSRQGVGYDIESRDGQTGRLRFIEVKGRKAGAATVDVYHTEILACLNQRDKGSPYILAVVELADGRASEPRYVADPFKTEPDSRAVSVRYDLRDLLAESTPPR